MEPFLKRLNNNIKVLEYTPNDNKIVPIRKLINLIKQNIFKIKYKNKFDFDTKLTEDTTIYARIAEIKAEEPEKPTEPAPEPEKDDEPKTGVESYLGVAVMAIVASVAGLYFVRKTAEK